MNYRSVPNLQDPSDSFFNAAGDGVSANAADLGDPSTPPPAVPVVTPVLSAEAVESEAAQSGPVTPVALTNGNGITINLLFDAAAMAAPASFRAGIEQAATILSNAITDKITINLQIDYSGTGGGASAGPDDGQFLSYSTVRSDLINKETPGDTTFNALPTGSTIQGQSNVAVWNAQLKLFGLLGANDTTTDDGSATFATDINPNLLVGVALHELTHALGRVAYGEPDGPQPDIFDFYRFTSTGTRLFTDDLPAAASYFSVNGGSTKIADYGQTSDPSDFLNPPGSALTANDAFNEFYNSSTLQQLTPIDLKELDALGFHTAVADAQAPTLVSDGPLPIVAGATQTITSSLLGATDNVSSGAALHYTVTASPVDGTLLMNGVSVTSFTQADINNGLVSYHETAGGPAISDNFHFTVTDAAGNTTVAETFQISIEQPPVVVIPSTVLSASVGQTFMASSLFSATDANGDILTYALFDDSPGATSGHFVVNGTVVPAETAYTITAAQLAQTTFVAGAAGTSDDLYVRAFDGQSYSNNGTYSYFHVNTAAPDHAPVVTIPTTVLSASVGQTFAASSLFSATDADGDTLTYTLFDDSTVANSGHFVVNGTVVPAETAYTITAAQLAQTTFVAGAAGTSNDLYVRAFDGQDYSNSGTYNYFHVNTTGDHAPVVTIPTTVVSASVGQTIAASSLFSATDADGNTLTYTLFDDSTVANSGHFVVNGTVVPAETAYTITAAQLAQTTFVAGAAGTSNDLYVRAFDGQEYSNNGTYNYFHVNTTGSVVAGNQPPVVTIPSTVVSANPGQTLQASSLFSATDANGDTLTYTLFDDSPGATSGHFVVAGAVVPSETAYTVTAAQLAQTTFVAGAAGTSDDLYVRAFDGQVYSNNGTYSYFHVNTVGAGQAPAAVAALPNASAAAPPPAPSPAVSVATLDAQAYADPAGHIASTIIHDFHLFI